MRQRNKPNHNIRKKFGKRIRKIRLKVGLSQEELGFKANVHRTYIGSIERGEQNISLDNIARLAKTLKISLSNLFNSI